jgi:hypothetical protein
LNFQHKTIQQIYDIINYRGNHTAPVDQLHYIKKLCEDRLRFVSISDCFFFFNGKSFFRDDILSEDEEDDELDSRNCTIDEEQNESLIIHPRFVLPQSSTKKRLLEDNDRQSKRHRYEDSSPCITFECYTSMSRNENLTRPFIVSTDIKMNDNEQRTCLTISKHS